ncbi:MAG: hypothetical protein LBO09_08885 [Candidatus Peribacteria bacterium]|jgi:hypothetical protein|nr:hypothetical protein [Candidatus Peribacteria bacterium]
METKKDLKQYLIEEVKNEKWSKFYDQYKEKEEKYREKSNRVYGLTVKILFIAWGCVAILGGAVVISYGMDKIIAMFGVQIGIALLFLLLLGLAGHLQSLADWSAKKKLEKYQNDGWLDIFKGNYQPTDEEIKTVLQVKIKMKSKQIENSKRNLAEETSEKEELEVFYRTNYL